MIKKLIKLEIVKQVAKGLGYGVAGGLSGLLFLAIISNDPEKFGNVADWLSGMGSVIAIFFVYAQIKQQSRISEEQKSHDFVIVINAQYKVQKNRAGGVTLKNERELVFLGTNKGMMPSSYKYVGITDPGTYKKTLDLREKEKNSDEPLDYPPIESFQFEYDLGIKKREFETVEPGGVSSPEVVDLQNVMENFKDKSDELVVVYMDVLGQLYSRRLILTE